MPPLPTAGDNSWRDDWAQAVHDAVVEVVSGRLSDATLMEAVRDVIGTALVAGANVTKTVDDTANTITIAAATGVPTTRQVNSGTGLTGGGDLSANRTLAVSYGTAAGTAVQGNDARVVADQAAGTASIRTLGTGATQAAAGNHTHADKLGIVSGSGLADVHKLTQAAYDALGTGRPTGRIYVIVG